MSVRCAHGLLSLSGVPLEGFQPVRCIYLDEAGISAKEPIVLIAGVIVHADTQWKALEERLGDIIDGIAQGIRPRPILHAKDLYHGAGKFTRDKYQKEQRWETLEKVLALPRELTIPIVFGWLRQDPDDPLKGRSPKDAAIYSQALASCFCLIEAEKFMRENAGPNEVALLIAEDNPVAKKAVRKVQHLLRDQLSLKVFPEIAHGALPLTKIVDTIHFAEKTNSVLLQLADACAFIVRRHISGGSNTKRFIDVLTGSTEPREFINQENYGGHWTVYWVRKAQSS
jgi:hypothetical protein